MKLISDTYRQLNKELHSSSKQFGSDSSSNAELVHEKFLVPYKITRFLDYGCGKGILNLRLTSYYGHKGENYDPANDEFCLLPAKTFEGVICMDVLEHVEPEYLDDTLKYLYQLSERYLFLAIALQPSNKTLPDGRNAHLIVHPKEWWLSRLQKNNISLVEEVQTIYRNKNEKRKGPVCALFTGVYEKE